MSGNETIEIMYDTINELQDNTEKLLNDNKIKESEIISNKKNIEKANQKIEKIMKDLVESGGFSFEQTNELKILSKLINNSKGEFEEHKIQINKCLELIINFANQYLDIYKKQNEEVENVVSEEEKLNELLEMSKEDLVDLCKDHDLSHTGNKKKLAKNLLSIYGF